MAVFPEDVAIRIREERRSQDAAAEARASLLRAKLGAAAEVLREAGARRLWLFGSLAAGAPRPESDVDLAVSELPSAGYFEALAKLMALFGTRVDLVRLEDAPESLRLHVLASGTEL